MSEKSESGAVEEELTLLRGALSDLRKEIADRLPARAGTLANDGVAARLGESGASAAQSDFLSLVDGLRSRLATFGMSEYSAEVDDFGLDANALADAKTWLDLLFDRYWRVTLEGSGRVPAAGPCLFVANRSGVLPYDGLMLAHALDRERSDLGRARFLVADWLATLPFAQSSLARLGGVRACRENADRLLRGGASVIAFPEGQKGAVKSFGERYRLQRFGRGGVVRTAIENRVPLVPVGIAGGEEVHPILYKSEVPARILGLPFLPLTPTFPLMGVLGLLPLPSKWVIRIGDPVLFDDVHPDACNDDVLISRYTEEVRAKVQRLVGEAVDQRESAWS